MKPLIADARPTRHFFIDVLTRDIALEDAILDLIDNAIDALTRSENIDLSEQLVLSPDTHLGRVAKIEVRVSEREIRVTDFCGGIERDQVTNNVFRIGKTVPTDRSSIGVYGIGLKRAVFKIGNAFEFTSKTVDAGFTVKVDDIDNWASDDSPDWNFPVADAPAARSKNTAGTMVRIWNLHDAIKRRIREGTLLTSLKNTVSRTYPLLLARFVSVTLNNSEISPDPLPIGASEHVAPAIDKLEMKNPDVRVTVLASVASPDPDERFSGAKAGWYIICNGRVVVTADKSDLTGWGTKHLPQFHSGKHRAFIGIVFFFSADPSALPWTTTKRGVDRDSIVFQRAQPVMALVGRQVLAFLNRWYPSEQTEAPAERAVAVAVERQDVREIAGRTARQFKADVKRKRGADKVKIQFDVTDAELARARRCLGKPDWSGVRIGRHAFEYFLKNECGNE